MVIVKSERDKDKIVGKMAALPTDRKGPTKAAKRVIKHKEIHLENDEFLAMLDSGSFLHAVNASEVLPLHKINPPGPRERRRQAETACGGILEILGTVDFDAEVDGHQVGVRFNHMNVNSPILSVRRLVKDGHEVYIGKGGGFVRHLETGRRLTFFEYQGVYYMKMKVTMSRFLSGREPEQVILLGL